MSTKLKAYEAARKAYRLLDQERDDAYNARLDAFKATLKAEIAALYDERLGALAEAETAACIAFEDETAAKAAEKPPYPIGTRLCVWKFQRWTRYYLSGKFLQWTGVLELVTRETHFKRGKGRYWRPPQVGSFIVSRLKKDGTIGEQFQEYNPNYHYLEGVDPNKKGKA